MKKYLMLAVIVLVLISGCRHEVSRQSHGTVTHIYCTGGFAPVTQIDCSDGETLLLHGVVSVPIGSEVDVAKDQYGGRFMIIGGYGGKSYRID